MLKASYLASISDELVKLFSQLEYEIKVDMARRIAKLEKLTDATEFQAEMLVQTGGLKADITQIVAKYDAKAKPIIEKVFNDAMEKASTNDLKYFSLAKRDLSESKKQVITTAIERFKNADTINKTFAVTKERSADQTFQTIQRMTMTVADSSNQKFLQEVNNAYMKVNLGGYDYKTAYKSAVKNLASDGVNFISYSSSGVTRQFTPEAAVRMNIMTSINQTASQQTLSNCDTLGTDLVEVDAHFGARDKDNDARPWANHAAWQGKIFCLNGERDYIDADGNTQHAPNFQETCGLGEVDGICGINCRHSYYPYFEGTPQEYGNGELDELKDSTVRYNGEVISQYEAEQKQRDMERAVRFWKTQSATLDAAGLDATEEKMKLGLYQEKLRDFVKETGLRRDYTREYIGTKDGKQPRGWSLPY